MWRTWLVLAQHGPQVSVECRVAAVSVQGPLWATAEVPLSKAQNPYPLRQLRYSADPDLSSVCVKSLTILFRASIIVTSVA